MKTISKAIVSACIVMVCSVLAGCYEDIDYMYSTPPVTVTQGSNSDAHYGPPQQVVTPSSDAHYGSSAPVPPVSVTGNNSGAYYGH